MPCKRRVEMRCKVDPRSLNGKLLKSFLATRGEAVIPERQSYVEEYTKSTGLQPFTGSLDEAIQSMTSSTTGVGQPASSSVSVDANRQVLTALPS